MRVQIYIYAYRKTVVGYVGKLNMWALRRVRMRGGGGGECSETPSDTSEKRKEAADRTR